jgi:hypothetical protein
MTISCKTKFLFIAAAFERFIATAFTIPAGENFIYRLNMAPWPLTAPDKFLSFLKSFIL